MHEYMKEYQTSHIKFPALKIKKPLILSQSKKLLKTELDGKYFNQVKKNNIKQRKESQLRAIETKLNLYANNTNSLPYYLCDETTIIYGKTGEAKTNYFKDLLCANSQTSVEKKTELFCQWLLEGKSYKTKTQYSYKHVIKIIQILRDYFKIIVPKLEEYLRSKKGKEKINKTKILIKLK